jgi:hypothetical protein
MRQSTEDAAERMAHLDHAPLPPAYADDEWADRDCGHLVERRRKAEGADLRHDDGDPYDVPPASLAWLVVAVFAAWGIVGGLGWLGVQVWRAL